MDISRRGSDRDRGTSSIIAGLSFSVGGKYEWQDNVRWDTQWKQIVISVPRVRHQDGRTHHNYQIRLSLNDVASLIAVVGHAGSAKDAELLRTELEKNVPAIVKLLACATGLVPTPMVETDAGSPE
jgi:hypothetical protein